MLVDATRAQCLLQLSGSQLLFIFHLPSCSHKGLTFNIISTSDNNLLKSAVPFSFWKIISLSLISKKLDTFQEDPACICSFVCLFLFLECFLVFLGKLSVYKHVQSRLRRQKEEIESARTIFTVQSLHTA